MHHSLNSTCPFAATFIAIGAFTQHAVAALTVTFEQVGPDVLVTITGSLDLSGLSRSRRDISYCCEDLWLEGASGWLWLSSTTTGTYDVWSGTGPLTVSGGFTNPKISHNLNYRGNIGTWGTLNHTQDIYVRNGYISNSVIEASTTIPGVSLDDLGMTVGDSQTVSWERGAGDSITFRAVPQRALPEPELDAERSGNGVRLSWPLSASAWILETIDALDSPAGWSPVSPPYPSDEALPDCESSGARRGRRRGWDATSERVLIEKTLHFSSGDRGTHGGGGRLAAARWHGVDASHPGAEASGSGSWTAVAVPGVCTLSWCRGEGIPGWFRLTSPQSGSREY